MEITIRGSPKDIAALAVALQERQEMKMQFFGPPEVPNPLGTITESFRKAIGGTAQAE